MYFFGSNMRTTVDTQYDNNNNNNNKTDTLLSKPTGGVFFLDLLKKTSRVLFFKKGPCKGTKQCMDQDSSHEGDLR